MSRLRTVLGAFGLLSVIRPATLVAHDCVGGADCLQTAGYNAAISVVGGLLAGGAAAIAGTLDSESFVDMTTPVDDLMGVPGTKAASSGTPAQGTPPSLPDDGSDSAGARSDLPPDDS